MNKQYMLILTWIYCISVPFVSADYWSIWTEWSECSRTCDGGATYQLRRCVRSRRYAKGCKGNAIRYSTCNNEPCSSDASAFRAAQCSAHDDELYSGKYLKWIPYHDSTSPCALYCKALGTNIIHLFAPKVLDGTRCKDDSLDMCINGKCWPVGCNRALGSRLQEDKCGVCGGRNECLDTEVKEAARFHWLNIGFGECSTSCGVGYQETNVICRNRISGRLVSMSACAGLKRPMKYRRKCMKKKCGARWMVGPWQECTQTCGGGFAWRIVRCVETLSDNTQQFANNSECREYMPSSRKSCNNQMCPTWYAGQWTPCGVTCGSGLQTREVVCRHTGDAYCNKRFRPLTKRNCTTNIPCFDQNDGRYAELYAKDVQEVMVGRKDSTENETPSILYEDQLDKGEITEPRFVVSRWGPCSVTCGPGKRWRFVRCKVYLPFLDSVLDLPDTECSDKKPVQSEACQSYPCYDEFEYRVIGMTPCSRSCLGGVQETVVKCAHKTNGTVVKEELCIEAQRKPIERRVCNDVNCPQRWKIGDFGSCSVTCGGGVMTRDVECIQEFAVGPKNVLRLPDFMCEQPLPPRSRPCGNVNCLPEWRAGNWSSCSVTCGSGIIIRNTFCVMKKADGLEMNVSYSACVSLQEPDKIDVCNMSTCPAPKIKALNIQFFQLDKIKKIKLTIGMEAAILPGTTIVLKCPTKGINPRDILWLKDGNQIERSNRVKVTSKMTLKIKKAIPEEDSGVYSCKIDSLQANSIIRFSNVYDLFRATILRERYTSGSVPSNLSKRNTSIYRRDPVSRQRRALYLVQSHWQSCSASCGGGLQSRNVSCEIITPDYYEVFPVRYCTKAGYTEPTLIRSCNTHPCVDWKTGNWSECSVNECVRNMFSLQRRKVDCATQVEGNVLNVSLCSHLGNTPPSEKECLNVDCVATWNTSQWTQCLGKCGERGFRTRMLNCIWTKTGENAGRNCELMDRPKAVRNCMMKPCSESCIDKSEYCSVVKLMKLCKYINFSRNCCISCKGS